MPDQNQVKQPLWRRIGKGILGAGITAAYVTGIALAAPVTLGVAAGLGALRNLATREKEQGFLSAIGKGAVQGVVAPFAAAATLASDAVQGKETNFNDLLLNSGRKMPEIPEFGKSEAGQKQPLWKRIGKVVAGAALFGGTIAACVVAGPVVAAAVAAGAAYGVYKGYKEAKASGKSSIWGAVKEATNYIISPITKGVQLMAHGVQGCETNAKMVNVFDGLGGQFAPNLDSSAAQKVQAQHVKPPLPPKISPEKRAELVAKLHAGTQVCSNLEKPATQPQVFIDQRTGHKNVHANRSRRNSTGQIGGRGL